MPKQSPDIERIHNLTLPASVLCQSYRHTCDSNVPSDD